MTSWSELPLTEGHAAYLSDQAAITAEVAREVGIRSAVTVEDLPEHARGWGEDILPALVFPYRSPDGVVVEQVKPCTPVLWEGKEQKYLWPAGVSSVLATTRVADDAHTVLIVEGTKQALAAASWAPEGVSVYGIAGCRSWSTGGVPITTLSVVEGKKAVIALDGDVASNFEVYEAAARLGSVLADEGAGPVLFARINAGRKTGLDDLLVSKDPARRTAFLARLIESAEKKPADVKPRPTKVKAAEGDEDPGGAFFDVSGLLVEDLSKAVRDRNPAALTEERRVALYRGGVFHIDGTAFAGAVAELLGNRFRPGHRAAVEEFTEAVLYNMDLFLPVHVDQPLLNVRNGMLDLATGTLKPHDPAYLSAVQIPVEWDEDATCPTYEHWADICGIGSQFDDLEETASTMLDPSRTPPKAVFLFGPSRSGKSTFLRLLQAVSGPRNYSAVTLHQLSQNRFAAANVFGKMLNCAADLSSAHVDDISIFKMMTGEDPIQADRKYGGQFAFVNRALFAFSANELPTVGESSKAYTERIKPFEFAVSFAGRENPQIELDMLKELPGILVRWVRAYQRRAARGTYLPTDPRVQHEFEVRSDRVRQWLDDRCTVWTETPDGRPVTVGTSLPTGRATPHAILTTAFSNWAQANNTAPMGSRKVLDRLRHVSGVFDVRQSPSKKRALNITVRDDDGGVWEDDHGPLGPGGTFEGRVALSPDQSATAQDQSATEEPQVREVPPEAVAEVALSEHPIQYVRNTPASHRTESDGVEGGSGGSVVDVLPKKSAGCSESATSATSAIARPDLDRVEKALAAQGVDQPSLFDSSPSVEEAPEYPKIDVRELDARGAVTLPEGIVALDIETSSEEQLWSQGPEFIRLCGYQTGDRITITPDAAELAEAIRGAKMVIGHNVMSFDLVAFARHHGVDLIAMAEQGRVFDTKLVGILSDPPTPGSAQAQIQRAYSLDNLGARLLDASKTGDLKALAKQFGGFDRIPLDDERYVRYLIGDVDLTARLAVELKPSWTSYMKREHRIAAIAARIRMTGFRVDVPELERRVVTNREARARHLASLADRYGLPTTKKDGKPSKSPHATAEGKAAIVQAFTDLGVELPTTEKGQPSFGKLALARVAEDHVDRPDVIDLVELVGSLNGVRTVYETVLTFLHGDRVHPEIGMFQASGRWSTTKPGLTVMGKRGGKYAEREVFLPEQGHAIVSADLAQVDARAIAALSQDPAYLAMFAPGLDLHREIATRVWGDPARRDDAKAIGHGWNYGMGIAGLSRNAKVSEDVAREFDRAMREQFPTLIAWRDGIRDAGEAGELLDNGFGRLMRVDPNRSWTQAPALMGQGCARDLMMEGLLRLPTDLVPMLRAVVHDEVILSVPLDQVDDVERAVLDALTFPWAPAGAEHQVQIEAGLGERRGINWGECYRK